MKCLSLLIMSYFVLYANSDHTSDKYLLCKPDALSEKRAARDLQGVQVPSGSPGFGECEKTNSGLRMELDEIKRQLKCRDGVVVGNICYRLLYSVGSGMVYDEARRLCLFHGGVLAETPTKEIYDAVYDYVRTTFTKDLTFKDRGHIRVWLGSMYQGGNVILSNGMKSYTSWYPAHPAAETQRTHMGIHVKFKPDDPLEYGMINIWPINTQVVPLCQFLLY